MIDATYPPVQLVELLLSDLALFDGGLAVLVEVKSGLCTACVQLAAAEPLRVEDARILTQTLWSRPEADAVSQNVVQAGCRGVRGNPLT